MTESIFEKANLDNADMRCIQANNAIFNEASMQNANLWAARIQNAKLSRTDLEGANLERTFATQCNMEDANLKDTNLDKTNLILANLKNTQCSEEQNGIPNITSAYLSGSNIEQAIETAKEMAERDRALQAASQQAEMLKPAQSRNHISKLDQFLM